MTSQLKTSIAPDVSLLVDGQTADAGDVLAAIEDLRDYVRGGQASISATDTHVKHLEDGVVEGTGIDITRQNSGANETLRVAVDTTVVATTSNTLTLANKTLDGTNDVALDALDPTNDAGATSGDILTWDGAQWYPDAPGGGGAAPIDIEVTAGENLSQRDFVYLDEATGTWFRIDTDASPIRIGRLRGCVVESGGITNGNSGDVRLLGEVSGFTSLTAWGRVYAGTSAGGYTQTRPTVTDGGSQVALAEMGVATTTSKIFVKPMPVQFLRRATLANDGTLTLAHYTDPSAREREIKAYVGTTVAGSSITSYSDANQDVDVMLEETSAAGGTTTIAASGGSPTSIGDISGTDYRVAQSFQVTAGRLSQFRFTLSSNNGSPSGTMTWQIREDNSGNPTGTILASGTLTPTASSENTVNVSNGPRLAASTTYWLVLYATNDQSSNVAWRWQNSASSIYANGEMRYSGDAGSSWTPVTVDMACVITTSAIIEKDRLAQSFQVGSNVSVSRIRLWLKKQGSPTGTLTIRIETNNAGSPSGTLVDANATDTVAASSVSASYGYINFDLPAAVALVTSTTYWIVLSTSDTASGSNYIIWGADGSTPNYSNGEMRYESASAWNAESKDAIFDVVGADTVYDERCTIGRWSGGTRDIAVRFDDGAAANPNTNTTFRNVSGGSLDLTCVVELQ